MADKYSSNSESTFKSLDQMGQCSMNEFTQYIIIKVLPSRENLDLFIKTFANEYSLDISKIEKDDIILLKKYLECFLDVLTN